MTNSSTSSITSNNNNNNNNHHSHHHHHHHHHRISNGTQACAACKYQRRKCAPDCILAPYFPHDRQRQFLNAHKLFGVSNITKIIRNLSPPDKDIAMRTIMYQSDARAKDPVGGSFRIIRDLHHQIEYCKAELDLVLQQLAICKAQQAYHQQQPAQTQVQFMQPMSCPPPPPQPHHHHHHDSPVGPEGDVIQTNEYQDQYQALMRCYYDEQPEYNNDDNNPSQQQQEDDATTAQRCGEVQYSWGGVREESVLATSNSSTTNNNNHNQYVMTGDLATDHHHHQPQMLHQLNNAVCASSYHDDTDFGSKFDDHHVDVSCSELHRDNGLKFDLHQTTEISEEELLKEDDKVILEHDDDESFHYHHIPEHDLRSAATLFTLN